MAVSDAILRRLRSCIRRSSTSLERVWRLLDRVGTLGRLPPVIHVAGTNGKGSVAYLRAMLEAGGRTVHAYTAPSRALP